MSFPFGEVLMKHCGNMINKISSGEILPASMNKSLVMSTPSVLYISQVGASICAFVPVQTSQTYIYMLQFRLKPRGCLLVGITVTKNHSLPLCCQSHTEADHPCGPWQV